MKKVYFITGQFPVVTQTFVVNQLKEAVRNGFNVNVVTYKKSKISNSSQTKILSEGNILDKTIQIDFKIPKHYIYRFVKGIILSVKNFKYLNKTRHIPKLHLLFTTSYKIPFFKTLTDISVFHVHFGHYGLDLCLMKKIGVLKSKIITTFHGYDANLKNEVTSKDLIELYKNVFEQSDAVTVNTNYLKEKLVKLNCPVNKIKVIPMGIDVKFFRIKGTRKIGKEKELNLISVGRLIELKGHQYAIKAIKKLVDLGYNVKYTIIGVGNLKSDILDLIEKLKLSEQIVLVGNKDQNEIKAYYKNSHIFLMCSVTDSDNRQEAQGIVTLEAQASGLPVIAFDSGGVKYTLSHNKTGFLVKEKDVDAYAMAIKKLIDDEALYKRFSRSGYKFVEKNFNLEKTSKEFLKLYN